MERNKGLSWIISHKKEILLTGLYFLSVVALIICMQTLPDKMLSIFGYSINVYRKIQFSWGISLCCTAIWKAIGYYIVRNFSVKIHILENLLLSILAFIWLQRWMADEGAPMSMQLCYLVLLTICDIVQIEAGELKKVYIMLYVMSYLLVGAIWGYCTNGLWWDKNYSVFSHIFVSILGIVLFLSLIGKNKVLNMIYKAEGKVVYKFLKYLELDDE